jgi:Exostosin family
MVLIHLTTTAEKSSWNPYALDNLNRIVRASQHSQSRIHRTTESISDADIILFIGSRRIYHSDIINSDIYRQYSGKCLVVDFQDITIPQLPGLYMNIPSYLHQYPIYEYGFYLSPFDDWAITTRAEFCNCKYLFSFVGDSITYPQLRQEVLSISHPQSYLKDTTNERVDYQIYSDILNSSKFVLCPRGIGASSFRVFETMRQSRVPVIISNEWIPPLGVEWNEFSIIIPEEDISSIPHLLEKMEDKAKEMGRRAFECWQANFSLENSFDWIAESALRIQSLRRNHQQVIQRNIYADSFRREHFANFWKEFIRRKLGNI